MKSDSKTSEVRAIEGRSLNAWPALHEQIYDGWLLRFSNGYTRRSNSINPIYPGERGIYEKVLHCERSYSDRGLPTVFKLTPLADPEDLDSLLDSRGYNRVVGTSVQVLSLEELEIPEFGTVMFRQIIDEDRLWEYARLKGMDEAETTVFERMMSQVPAPVQYVSLLDEQEPVAMGVAVQEGEYSGLFGGLVTDRTKRQQGFGTRLVWAILDEAKTSRAKKAYLQVEVTNDPALRLYIRLGFEELYRYWYRVKERN